MPSRYCEVGVALNGSVYLPASDGAVATCSDAVAALRAVKRPSGSAPLTVQGVISLIKCPGVEQNPAIFIDSAAAFADEFSLDGLSLDWEACPYACDAKPIDCGCYGCAEPCTCKPAGFGTRVAQTVNALGKKLLQKKRKLTVALGVLKKDVNGNLVNPPYVCEPALSLHPGCWLIGADAQTRTFRVPQQASRPPTSRAC